MNVKYHKLSDVSLNWINNLPKTIDINGCWIPFNIPTNKGYIRIQIEKKLYYLHRLSMCENLKLDYHNLNIETRHSSICSKACFNPEHLKPGTASDNAKDSVKDGTHFHASKEFCSNCNSRFQLKLQKGGMKKGKILRICRYCRLKTVRRYRERLKINSSSNQTNK